MNYYLLQPKAYDGGPEPTWYMVVALGEFSIDHRCWQVQTDGNQLRVHNVSFWDQQNSPEFLEAVRRLPRLSEEKVQFLLNLAQRSK